MTVIGWVLAIGIPILLAASIIQDGRAQAAHDRHMANLRAAVTKQGEIVA